MTEEERARRVEEIRATDAELADNGYLFAPDSYYERIHFLLEELARREKGREATEEEVGRLITETHDLNAGLQLCRQERDGLREDAESWRKFRDEDQLRVLTEALLFFKQADREDGPCWCGYEQEHISPSGPDMGCVRARAALGIATKPQEGK